MADPKVVLLARNTMREYTKGRVGARVGCGDGTRVGVPEGSVVVGLVLEDAGACESAHLYNTRTIPVSIHSQY